MAFDFPSSPAVNQGFQGWVYDGEKWVLKPGGGMIRRYAYVATASQTVFSGADVNGQTLAYTPSALEVIVNGVTLPQADYTATNGTSVTLGLALAVGDYVYIQAFESFPVTDAVSVNWSQSFTNAQISQGVKNLGLPFIFQGYINGLILSTAGSSSTFSISRGACIDDSISDWVGLGSTISKTTGAWVAGSGNGALDTGSIANNTWYHVYAIRNPVGAVNDILISTSASSPTMPSNYTLKRRIGSMLTNGSAQWVKFVQVGDQFIWDTVFVDINGITPGVTTAALRTLTVPPGVQVIAHIRANTKDNTSAGTQIQLSSPDESDQTTFFDMVGAPSAGFNTYGNFNIRTNTSAQIRTRQNSTTVTMSVWTYGWTDQRGKNS